MKLLCILISCCLLLLRKIKVKKILDLGCGVGGTIRYLKKKYNADYSGITLSSIQTEISQSLGTSVETADYLDTDWYRKRGSFDLIYAIESLQHNPDHEKLCRNLKLVSDSGTEIVVIDDFIIGNMRKSRSALFFKKMFIKHWHAYGFIDINEFSAVFEKHNFRLIEQQNLSEYMKRNIFLDFLAGPAALAAIIFPFKNPYIDNIIGGQSLKKLQTEGYSGYYKLVFRYN